MESEIILLHLIWLNCVNCFHLNIDEILCNLQRELQAFAQFKTEMAAISIISFEYLLDSLLCSTRTDEINVETAAHSYQLNISLLFMWINAKASPVLAATAPNQSSSILTHYVFTKDIKCNKQTPPPPPCPICMTDYTVVQISLCCTIDVIQWKMNIFISYSMKTLIIHHLRRTTLKEYTEIHWRWHFMLLAVDFILAFGIKNELTFISAVNKNRKVYET